jgi:hypothetical protein
VAQLSLPFRIGLIALLVVSALWFTVLKPKGPAPEPVISQAPGVTGLSNAVGAAKGAAATSASSAAGTQAATGSAGATTTSAPAATAGTATQSATPNAATPRIAATAKAKAATSGDDPSAPLIDALGKGRAVVLLFWDERGSEDQFVRRAVAATDRRNGKVVVQVAAVKDVGRYQAITRGVQIDQSPTVLIIAPGLTAKPIVGLTTTDELDQAAGDALAQPRKG